MSPTTTSYLFAHRVLRDAAWDTNLYQEAQGTDLRPVLVGLWQHLAERVGTHDEPTDVAAFVVEEPGLNGVLVTLPEPTQPGEAYAVFAEHGGRYLTYELGADSRAYLGGWLPSVRGPQHRTYRELPPADLDAFVAAVADLV